MDYTTKLLKKLIAEQVKLVFLEQEELDLSDDSSEDAGSTGDGGLDLDLGGDDLDAGAEGDLDLGDDVGGGDLGDDAGELGDLEDDGDFGGDFGGGGGFGGGSSFGGGGGGLDDMGGGDDSESDVSSPSAPSEEEEEGQVPSDPKQGVVDDIKAALEQTQDVQPLLNVAKSSIQKYFDSFEDSSEVVSMLQQEDNPVLQDVAKRLNMFLKGF